MIRDQCSGPPKVNHLPDQDVNARAATVVGAPAQGRNGQIQDSRIDPRLGGRREWCPTAPPHAPIARGPIIGAHSTPIARAAGGAV
jgi:hypothetical protein